MLRKVTLFALLGICCAFIFNHNDLEDGLKKSMPLRTGIRRFVQNIPEEEANKVTSDTSEYLLDKLRSSILLKGMPLGSHRPELVLPLGVNGLQVPSSQSVGGGRRLTLKSFDITNCTKKIADKDVFVVRKLAITPDPIALPGIINFEFDLNILKTIESLDIDLTLYKKVYNTWNKIPCLGQFGSCTYHVCELLEQVASCPSELVDIGIDCKCPFVKGTYDMPSIKAEIDGEVFVPGDYFASGLMTSSGNFIGCYNATFSLIDG